MASAQKRTKLHYDPDLVRRLWARDGTLWSDDASCIDAIRKRLGWLDSPRWLCDQVDDLQRRIGQIQERDWKRVVLIGMGGSSLAPSVLSRMAPNSTIGSGYPRLEVLDTTHPDVIRNTLATNSLAETLFVVSSKSGKTLEVKALWSYVDDLVRQEMFDETYPKNFVAITDEDTPLATLAREKEFLDCFINPADVGGRFSALTYYGMVPAALLGFDLFEISELVAREAETCRTEPSEYNKVVDFGWQIGRHAVDGRDKLTLILSPEIEPIGVWIEQLLAESTGKNGRGIVPIIDEPMLPLANYGEDRIFVAILLNNDLVLMEACRELELAGFPVFRSEIRSPNDVACEFFRWGCATAIAGVALEINPFDEPDVQHTKDATSSFLEGNKTLESSGLDLCIEQNGVALIADPYNLKELSDIAVGMNRFFGSVGKGDYVAILCWLEESEEVKELLEQICGQIREFLKVPAVINFGPRYLHSTGQLHKGGSNCGIFLQIVGEAENDLPVPRLERSFSDFHRAQADADLAVLSDLGRRVVRIDLGADTTNGLIKLVTAFNRSLSV